MIAKVKFIDGEIRTYPRVRRTRCRWKSWFQTDSYTSLAHAKPGPHFSCLQVDGQDGNAALLWHVTAASRPHPQMFAEGYSSAAGFPG